MSQQLLVVMGTKPTAGTCEQIFTVQYDMLPAAPTLILMTGVSKRRAVRA